LLFTIKILQVLKRLFSCDLCVILWLWNFLNIFFNVFLHLFTPTNFCPTPLRVSQELLLASNQRLVTCCLGPFQKMLRYFSKRHCEKLREDTATCIWWSSEQTSEYFHVRSWHICTHALYEDSEWQRIMTNTN